MFPLLTTDAIFGMTLGEFALTAGVVVVCLIVLFWALRQVHII
jgi:hypothetical protein